MVSEAQVVSGGNCPDEDYLFTGKMCRWYVHWGHMSAGLCGDNFLRGNPDRVGVNFFTAEMHRWMSEGQFFTGNMYRYRKCPVRCKCPEVYTVSEVLIFHGRNVWEDCVGELSGVAVQISMQDYKSLLSSG